MPITEFTFAHLLMRTFAWEVAVKISSFVNVLRNDRTAASASAIS